jgi:O-antigen ligase
MQKFLKRSDRLIKYLVATILLVVPLYPKFPFIRVPGTFVSIRLEDFLILVSLLVLFFYLRPSLVQFLKGKINRTFIFFLISGFLSLLSAIFLTKTIVPHIGLLHWLRRIEYLIPFFLGVLAIKNKRQNLDFYLKVLMIVVFLAFIYGFGQKNFGWPVIITQNKEYAKGIALKYIPGAHINSTFAGHYDLASFLVLILPIYVCLFALMKNLTTGAKIAIGAVIFSGLWLLGNSGSRISVVSYLMSVTFALILVKKYRAIPLVILLSLLFFVMSSNLMTRYGRIFNVLKKKVEVVKVVYAQSGSVSEDRSTSIRLNVEWPRAIRAFAKNPLLGTGYSSITLATDNDYLRLLGEVGILGFSAFFLIFFRMVSLILKSFPLTKNFKQGELSYLAGFVGALSGIFLNAVFIDVFEASKFAIIFWLLAGFMVGLLNYDQNY